jgi:FkbM family methyltransferase
MAQAVEKVRLPGKIKQWCAQLATVYRTARYNRDWLRYAWGRLASVGDDRLLTFRLRNGQRMTLLGSTRETLNEIYLHRVYDIPGVDFRKLEQVFDFGANMGVFALYVAARAPTARIACFEPASENLSLLEQNLSFNRVRAHAYRMAISSACGPRRFSLAGNAAQHALGGGGGAYEMVDCADLAKVFSLTGADVCDFLKMDIEGEELDLLLRTPLDLLRRIRAMAIEWHHPRERLAEVRSRLERAGFETKTDFMGYDRHQIMLKAWKK